MVLALLQQVLVAPISFLLIAHPATLTHTHAKVEEMQSMYCDGDPDDDDDEAPQPFPSGTHIPPRTLREPTEYMKAPCCLSTRVMKSLMLEVRILDLPVKYDLSKISICRQKKQKTVTSDNIFISDISNFTSTLISRH